MSSYTARMSDASTPVAEHRLPALVAAALALLLFSAVPPEVRVIPVWVVPVVGALLLLPSILINPKRLNIETTWSRWIGIAFALLWRVLRDWSKEWMFGYFVVNSLFFYTVVPIYAIPHGALGMEMTDDYHEKTNLFAYASFIGNIGALTLP